MRTSEVLRRAAEKICTDAEFAWHRDRGRRPYPSPYCCHAITICTNSPDGGAAAMRLFAGLFAPYDDDTNRPWWRCPSITDEDQEARRLALLFAALIAEDQGD